ncbi:unnamed protein product [Porites evermanni]|uniref:PARP n=1 Tax=Porites evermanni TaxID=104178 RepID=A0ABN8SCB5_9CNID|nr:unnamed protein product [Porites evermanni]
MASCSTSNHSSPSGSLLPQILSKHRPLEVPVNTAPSPESNLSNNEYILSDCKLMAAMDEKFLELLPHFEALKRSQCYIRNFLRRKAEKVRRGENVDDNLTDWMEDGMGSAEENDGQLVTPVILLPRLFESKAEMAKLENRSFVFKLWLRRINITRCENYDEYISLQDLEHAIYEVHEAIEEYKEFIIMNFYNMKKLEEMGPFFADRQEASINKVLEEQEKASFKLTMEDIDRFHCPNARLSALLGLKLDFLDRLKEVPPEHCEHRTLGDWIVVFLRNNIIRETFTSKDSNVVTKELLEAIGFDPLSTTVETIISRSRNMQRHIEAYEWAEIFIRDEVKYHPLLYSLSSPYPFQANLINSWFQLPSRTNEESECEIDPCQVNIMNLVTEESKASNATQTILNEFLPREEQLLFHGTDHFSAADIFLRGIDLSAGRQKRDFSCGSGFYLSNSLDSALNWAKSTTAKPAILVFKVNGDILNDARPLNLINNEERWSEIVSSFRLGRRTAKTRKSLNSFDFIEGPVATLASSESSEVIFEPKPSSHQICLISDEFGEKFHQTLHSIIFYYFS